MKARRSFYNIIFGLLSQILSISIGIIIPRFFILSFGSEVNGFMSSITQIFVYMSLLEAGVGTASIQALYKPISINDKDSINGILAATSKFYKRTGIYYLLSVIILSIAYPLCIKSNISYINIFLVILLTGLVNVAHFFTQAKFKLLLTAEGKSYVITNIGMIVNILINIAKIILILLGFNIVIVQLTYFIINIIQMFIVLYYMKKNYTWINLNVNPNYSAISQKNSVLIHQIAGMIFSNTDVVVLTIFCGLKVVSVYVMYNLIFQMINNAIFNIDSGVIFILGSVFNEDKNKFLNLYNSYELYYMGIVFALYTITYILILPFMKLYTVGITDINYIDYWLPILFAIVNLMSFARAPGSNAINIAGHFRKTQSRAILESMINIIISLICVRYIGIYGVLIGTICALFYRTNDIIIYVDKNILKRSSLITYKRWLTNIIIFISISIIVNKFNIFINSYFKLVISGIILGVIIIPIFIIVGSIFNIKTFSYTLNYIKIYSRRFYKR